MMIENLTTILGLVLIWLSNGIPMLFLGRFLTGYVNGSNKSSILPYTSEICQPKIRKFTGTFFSTYHTSGYASMYVLGVFLRWRQISAILIVFPFLSLILLFFCPESPTWLLVKGRTEDAYQALFRIRGNQNVVEKEMKEMMENIRSQKSHHRKAFSSSHQTSIITSAFFKGTFVRPFLLLIIMNCFGLYCTGGPTLAFYLINVLQREILPIDPYVAAAWLVTWRVVITVTATLFLSPFIPRRKLYLTCSIILATGALLFGTFSYVERFDLYQRALESYQIIRWFPFLSVGLIYTGLSGGFTMITFTLLGELLPSNARGLGTGLVSGTSYIILFLIAKFTPSILQEINVHGLFWINAVVAYCLTIFAYFCLPETFGKTLEDIENHYRVVCYGEQAGKSNRIKINNNVNTSEEPERRRSIPDIHYKILDTPGATKIYMGRSYCAIKEFSTNKQKTNTL